MSELRVDSVKSKGGGAPNLPKGVTISGITTAVTLGVTNIDGTNVNVSGVVTSGTLSGELLSTGTPTLGLGVTINSSGVVISGVATAGIVSATTLYGDGTNLTGVGVSLAPLFYNPDPYDTLATIDTGIGITFNQQVKAGTGNVTLSIANAGVAGTVVENFGVGSSVSISENRITINPTADLTGGEAQYFISYPSGAFTNNEGTDYVGTGYTFGTREYLNQLWLWGQNEYGTIPPTQGVHYSSPVQLPGTTWSSVGNMSGDGPIHTLAAKTDGTLWAWGENAEGGALGQNNRTNYSSPVQIPGTTWGITRYKNASGKLASYSVKTDGTLWVWGRNNYGALGLNQGQGDNSNSRSSPTQVPGTTWDEVYGGWYSGIVKRTDGTIWVFGRNTKGQLGLNSTINYSSPVQLPGTTWNTISTGPQFAFGTKTDGTLWSWGLEEYGQLGHNNAVSYSSPAQIPGTTWSKVRSTYGGALAIKTDGTLWAWGGNAYGNLGQNQAEAQLPRLSSPVQIPGTTWVEASGAGGYHYCIGRKTDGTLWGWGGNGYGRLGQNQTGPGNNYSSPVQIGSDTTWTNVEAGGDGPFVIKQA